MVDAARANDWERLVSLEHGCAVLRETLIAGADPDPGAAISPPEIGRKRELILLILADDAEIRRHVDPWMRHAREFLDSQTHCRQVQKAYAATDSGPGRDIAGGAA
jgi:flagellar protein FliT